VAIATESYKKASMDECTWYLFKKQSSNLNQQYFIELTGIFLDMNFEAFCSFQFDD
jgi:hypothetical protein